jgi:hypothetical protein
MNPDEHLITVLIEECAEVAKECCKANRFGLDDQLTLNPDGPRGTEGPTNREKIIAELNDLMGTTHEMVMRGILPADWQDAGRQYAKQVKIRKFMDYALTVDALQP